MARQKKEEIKSQFSVSGQFPERLSPQEKVNRILESIKAMQAVEQDYVGLEEVTVNIKGNRPIIVMTIADLHIGSLATNHDEIIKLRDAILKNPDVCVILLGDEIEGLVAKYLDTNAARTIPDVHEQIDMLKELFIRPLAEQDKIVAMVSGYFGHNGWAQDAATINPSMLLADEFGIPIIRNGGSVIVRYEDGGEQLIAIHHNPPGKSKFDPVYGLREATQGISQAHRPHLRASGHTHSAGIANENQPASNSGARQTQSYINTGAFKGSSKETPPDRFGVKLGFPLADPGGQGALLYQHQKPDSETTTHMWPALATRQLELMQNALGFWNDQESNGVTKELMELIGVKIEPPQVYFNEGGNSTLVSTPYDEEPGLKKKDEKYQKLYGDMPIEQYQNAAFNIVSPLPISLDFISNVRAGSHASGYEALKRYFEARLTDNPYALVAFLRNIIDMDAASDPERKKYLDQIIEFGQKYPNQFLAVLHDENMRNNSWKSTVGKGEGQGPIPAGSYLANGLGENAKLLRHKSTLEMAVGPSHNYDAKPKYTTMLIDKPGKFGSSNRPTYGLTRIYLKQTSVHPGMMAGGHLAMSGFSSQFDSSNDETKQPVFIAPGWWADTVDTEGKGNAGPGAVPGQAVILMPGNSADDYLVIPTVDAQQTQLFHEALLLYYGAQILGLGQKTQKRRKGKH